SFATSRNEGLPSRTISFIVIISLITPKMFIICIGSFLKDWDWDCAYSSHQKHLRLLVPPKELLFLVQNLYTATYALVCYPLWPVAFRGHGFSLLAPARGMPTLSAKDGFSRPSLKPVPASSSNASEYASSAQGNKEVYSSSPHSAGSSDTCFSRRSQRSSAPNNHLNSENELYSIVAKHHVSEGNTRRLQRESEYDGTPQRAFFASEEAHREPAESVVYFQSGKLLRSSLYQLRGLKATTLFDGTSKRSPSPKTYEKLHNKKIG